jgi:hypothetical protein
MAAATSSGLKSSSAAIVTGPGKVRGLMVETDGTNAGTVIVYDNTAASGTELVKAVVAGADRNAYFPFEEGIWANTGIYLALSGTGCKAIVLYDKG